MERSVNYKYEFQRRPMIQRNRKDLKNHQTLVFWQKEYSERFSHPPKHDILNWPKFAYKNRVDIHIIIIMQ